MKFEILNSILNNGKLEMKAPLSHLFPIALALAEQNNKI